jgi:hypothetical protein
MATKSKKGVKGAKTKKSGKKSGKKAGTQGSSGKTRFEIEIEDDRVTMTVFPGGSRNLTVASSKGPPIKGSGKLPPIKGGGKGSPIKGGGKGPPIK